METQPTNKYDDYLKQLYEFQKQGENLQVEEFEKWKLSLMQNLEGSYKIRLRKLNFYTYVNESDDLPF